MDAESPKQIDARVREILFTTWDPLEISYNPNLVDEYDGLVPSIIRLMERCAGFDEYIAAMELYEETLAIKSPASKKRSAVIALLEAQRELIPKQ